MNKHNSDMPVGKLKRVKDFLPSPDRLKMTGGKPIRLSKKLRREVKNLLAEDRNLLKRLAKE